jgi:toxin ParE1/3/4
VSRVVILPQAERELDDCAAYIARHSQSAAQRFYSAAQRTFEFLAAFPEAGSLMAVGRPDLVGVRVMTVRRYPNYLVFYRPITDGIEVLRVVHGSRDLDQLLSDEP